MKTKSKRTVRKTSGKHAARAPRPAKAPVLLQVWMDKSLYEWTKNQAKKEFRTMSAWLRMLLTEKRAAKR